MSCSDALECLNHALTGEQYLLLKQAATDQGVFSEFAVFLTAGAEQDRTEVFRRFRELVEAVDDSSYDLPAWIEASARLHGWLHREDKSAYFSDCIGYLNCVSEWGSSHPPLQTMADAVDDMLHEFGFDAAV